MGFLKTSSATPSVKSVCGRGDLFFPLPFVWHAEAAVDGARKIQGFGGLRPRRVCLVGMGHHQEIPEKKVRL